MYSQTHLGMCWRLGIDCAWGKLVWDQQHQDQVGMGLKRPQEFKGLTGGPVAKEVDVSLRLT